MCPRGRVLGGCSSQGIRSKEMGRVKSDLNPKFSRKRACNPTSRLQPGSAHYRNNPNSPVHRRLASQIGRFRFRIGRGMESDETADFRSEIPSIARSLNVIERMEIESTSQSSAQPPETPCTCPNSLAKSLLRRFDGRDVLKILSAETLEFEDLRRSRLKPSRVLNPPPPAHTVHLHRDAFLRGLEPMYSGFGGSIRRIRRGDAVSDLRSPFVRIRSELASRFDPMCAKIRVEYTLNRQRKTSTSSGSHLSISWVRSRYIGGSRCGSGVCTGRRPPARAYRQRTLR
jgi:hypothetical protein